MYTHPDKVYVVVDVRMDTLGRITPRTITWENNQTFEIDEVLDQRRAASLKAGGVGWRYTVRIGRTTTYIWREEDLNKWFVERR